MKSTVVDFKTGRRFQLEPIVKRVEYRNAPKGVYGEKYQGVIIIENGVEVGRALVKESPYKAIDKILKAPS